MKISHMIRQLGIGSKPKDGLKQIGQHPLPRSQTLRIITPSGTTLESSTCGVFSRQESSSHFSK